MSPSRFPSRAARHQHQETGRPNLQQETPPRLEWYDDYISNDRFLGTSMHCMSLLQVTLYAMIQESDTSLTHSMFGLVGDINYVSLGQCVLNLNSNLYRSVDLSAKNHSIFNFRCNSRMYVMYFNRHNRCVVHHFTLLHFRYGRTEVK